MTVFTVAVFGMSPCRSATIYDTTPPATSLDFDVSPTVKQATRFQTTASDFVITSMAFNFRTDSEDPATGFLNWLIYTDSNALPDLPIAGNPIYNMDVAGLTTSYSPVSTGAVNVPLLPSTTYWLVFNGESLSSGVLQLLESAGPSGVGGPFKGASYLLPTGPWSGNTAVAASGVITAVPEPSTYAMALAGVACGGFSMWRRRRRNRPRKTSGRCQAVTRVLAIIAMCTVCFSMRSADAVPTLADISWGSATNISGDSDVDTIGTLVYAYNFGSGTSATTQTINGATFQPFVIDTATNSQTTGNVTVSEDSGYIGSDFFLGSGTTPFSGLSSNYRSLLSSEVYANNAATMQVDLGGLTPGDSYRLQWWTNDSASLTGFGTIPIFENVIASGSSSMVTLDANTSGIIGGLGQYVLGTFTANSATESFTLTGSGTGGINFPMMNALQLRTVAVPEPSTYAMALAGLACGGFSMWRRRNTGPT